MAVRHLAGICAAAVFAFLCADAGRAQQPPTSQAAPLTGPIVLDAQGGQIRVVPIATGLVHPWSLSFLPDGQTLLVTEPPGRLRVIRNGVLDATPAWTAPAQAPAAGRAGAAGGAATGGRAGRGDAAGNAAAGGRGGRGDAGGAEAAGGRGARGGGQGGGGNRLHAVAVHPQFAKNRLVYLSYPKTGERGSTLAIGRGRFDGTSLADFQEIFVADAWETGGNLGGRIMFGPDGTLYVAVGDRDRICCNGSEDNSLRLKAQDLSNHIGKTLRIRDDGSVPPDNPLVGRPGVKPEIFTYGHRNTYGFAFHPETGQVWQAEIGPMGGDEVNILIPGHNYGWPLVSMGRNYTGSLVSDQPWFRDGMDNPRMFWVPSISPSSITFYTGDRFPRWKGSLLLGALNGQSLQRISFNQPSQAERREPLLRQLNIRVRDVVQGPDGLVYVATERTSGGAAADGMVLRMEPVN
jgi:glucose/arabinose dehydrogenase